MDWILPLTVTYDILHPASRVCVLLGERQKPKMFSLTSNDLFPDVFLHDFLNKRLVIQFDLVCFLWTLWDRLRNLNFSGFEQCLSTQHVLFGERWAGRQRRGINYSVIKEKLFHSSGR